MALSVKPARRCQRQPSQFARRIAVTDEKSKAAIGSSLGFKTFCTRGSCCPTKASRLTKASPRASEPAARLAA